MVYVPQNDDDQDPVAPIVSQEDVLTRQRAELDRLKPLEKALGSGVLRTCSEAGRYDFLRDLMLRAPHEVMLIAQGCGSKDELDSRVDHAISEAHHRKH